MKRSQLKNNLTENDDNKTARIPNKKCFQTQQKSSVLGNSGTSTLFNMVRVGTAKTTHPNNLPQCNLETQRLDEEFLNFS